MREYRLNLTFGQAQFFKNNVIIRTNTNRVIILTLVNPQNQSNLYVENIIRIKSNSIKAPSNFTSYVNDSEPFFVLSLVSHSLKSKVKPPSNPSNYPNCPNTIDKYIGTCYVLFTIEIKHTTRLNSLNHSNPTNPNENLAK